MSVIVPYARVLHAGDSPRKELARVAPFGDLLPSAQGHAFPFSDEELLARGGVPDPKVFRHVARSGCLLLLHYQELRDRLGNRDVNPGRVGIYGVVNQAPCDWHAIAEIAKAEPAKLAGAMRKELPRKQIFKTSSYSGIAQLGILLGVHGPQFTYFDEGADFPFLLDQARFDLEHGAVELAILLGANALDDPLALVAGEAGDREVSACCLIAREHVPLLGKRALPRDSRNGSAAGMVAFLEGLPLA